jgi:hypothetical protein
MLHCKLYLNLKKLKGARGATQMVERLPSKYEAPPKFKSQYYQKKKKPFLKELKEAEKSNFNQVANRFEFMMSARKDV